MIRERYPDYHPVLSMVEIAQATDDEQLELKCHVEVAKYVVAIDKFVEVKNEVTKTKRVVVELFGGPDQQRATALPHAPSQVFDATDVLNKREAVQAGAVGVQDSTVRRTSVSVTGPVEEEPASPSADVLKDVWGVGAGRFG